MLQFNFKQNIINIASILALVIVLLLGLGVQSSEAILKMTLSDGTTEILVIDNVQNDSLTALGGIIYNGDVGIFNISISTALSKPLIGSSSHPELYLSSMGVSSNSESGGMLTVILSNNDFDANSATGFLSYIGGVSSGTVTLNNYLSESNVPFATDINIGTYTSFNQGAFSGTASYDGIIPENDFSLTTRVNITHDRGTFVSSFSSHLKPDNTPTNITVIPEPVSTLLFIIGGALMTGRRFRNSQKQNR